MSMTEDKNLIVRPYFIESDYKLMWVFCNFINRGQSGSYIVFNEALYVLSSVFVDLGFVFSSGSGFGISHIVHDAKYI